MPDATHLEQLEAIKDFVLADSEETRARAFAESTDAEQRHLEALRVERGSRRSTIIGALIGIALCAILLGNLLNSNSIGDAADNAQFAADQAKTLAAKLGQVQASERRAAIESCERQNEARVASVDEKRQSITTLRKTIHLWQAALAAAPPAELEANPVAPLFLSYLHSLEDERDTKREAIRKTIEAQADVAVRPGSPRVNCKDAALAAFHP